MGVEILLRVHDTPIGTKRGHVIVVTCVGHVWGTEELGRADWRILRVTDATDAEARPLLEPGASGKLRKFKIDPNDLPPALASWVADDTRAVPIMSMTKAQLIAAWKDA